MHTGTGTSYMYVYAIRVTSTRVEMAFAEEDLRALSLVIHSDHAWQKQNMQHTIQEVYVRTSNHWRSSRKVKVPRCISHLSSIPRYKTPMRHQVVAAVHALCHERDPASCNTKSAIAHQSPRQREQRTGISSHRQHPARGPYCSA